MLLIAAVTTAVGIWLVWMAWLYTLLCAANDGRDG